MPGLPGKLRYRRSRLCPGVAPAHWIPNCAALSTDFGDECFNKHLGAAHVGLSITPRRLFLDRRGADDQGGGFVGLDQRRLTWRGNGDRTAAPGRHRAMENRQPRRGRGTRLTAMGPRGISAILTASALSAPRGYCRRRAPASAATSERNCSMRQGCRRAPISWCARRDDDKSQVAAGWPESTWPGIAPRRCRRAS